MTRHIERKREDGKIGWYGITNIDLADLAGAGIPPGLVSFSFEYSLADRRHEATILRMCGPPPPERQRPTFLSWGSLGQGILTGKYGRGNLPGEGDRRSRSTYGNFHGARLDRNLRIVDALRDCGERADGRSPSQVAVRWILDRLESSVVLAGIKSRAQLDDNLGAIGWHLEDRDYEKLDRLSQPAELIEA